MAEKRVQRRHRKRLQVRYGPDGPNRVGFTEDVSEEGFFLKATFVHPPRTILKIEMTTPGGEEVVLEGVVRWAKKVPPTMIRKIRGGMGVKLLRVHSGEPFYRALCTELSERL